MKVITFCICIILLGCSPAKKRILPFYNTAEFTPQFITKAPDDYHKIPPFQLTTQTGQAFTEKGMNNKISVVNFFFTTCPGICPRMAVNMKLLQDTFKNNPYIQLLSHSAMPEKDSVPVLARYAIEHHVNNNTWRLLTGKKSDLYTLGRKYYFIEENLGKNLDSTDFLHTENFVLVDKDRHLRGIYNGLKLASIQALIADIRTLEDE